MIKQIISFRFLVNHLELTPKDLKEISLNLDLSVPIASFAKQNYGDDL